MRLFSKRRGNAIATLVFSVSFFAADAWAQPAPSQSSADQLFEDGRKAMTQGQFETAARLLEASQKADPAAGTLLNLAECYEKLNKIATAVEIYTQAEMTRNAPSVRSGPSKHPSASPH